MCSLWEVNINKLDNNDSENWIWWITCLSEHRWDVTRSVLKFEDVKVEGSDSTKRWVLIITRHKHTLTLSERGWKTVWIYVFSVTTPAKWLIVTVIILAIWSNIFINNCILIGVGRALKQFLVRAVRWIVRRTDLTAKLDVADLPRELR